MVVVGADGFLSQVVVAAPLGFLFGLLTGLAISGKWALVKRKDFDIVPHDQPHRDYNRERDQW